MTEENARELAQRMRQRGYIVQAPEIEDDVLEAHLKKQLEKKEASQLPKPDVGKGKSQCS